jgi:hypothetical protein
MFQIQLANTLGIRPKFLNTAKVKMPRNHVCQRCDDDFIFLTDFYAVAANSIPPFKIVYVEGTD